MEPNTLEEAPPRPSPLVRSGQIETDTFCECGYNLFGQQVTRDERLNIMICRCPECARFHPAGHGTTAKHIWLSRLGVIALSFWVVSVVGFILLDLFFLGVTNFGSLHGMTRGGYVTYDGREVEYRYDAGTGKTAYYIEDTSTVAQNYTWRRKPVGWSELRNHWNEWSWILLIATFLAFVPGALMSVAMWHLQRKHVLLAVLLPFVVALFVMWAWLSDNDEDRFIGWVSGCLVVFSTYEAVIFMLGILWGRPLARGLVRLIIPPKPRQALGFLWRADGLSPPPLEVSR